LKTSYRGRHHLLNETERLGRLLGISGTHPIGDWREQEIIDQPHYRRLEEKLGWLIKRNNTFALHTHYAVKGRAKAIYLYNRLRVYVPPHARAVGQLTVLAGRDHGHAVVAHPDLLTLHSSGRRNRTP
jgi:carboxylate-amine ligase